MINSPVDKRRHKRYTLTNDTIVVCSANCGQVIDISEGGLSIKYINLESSLPEKWTSSIQCTSKNLFIPQVPLMLARRDNMQFSPFSSVHTQTVGVKFNNPDPSQKDQIRRFISALCAS